MKKFNREKFLNEKQIKSFLDNLSDEELQTMEELSSAGAVGIAVAMLSRIKPLKEQFDQCIEMAEKFVLEAGKKEK